MSLSLLAAHYAKADCATEYLKEAALIKEDRIANTRGIGAVMLVGGAGTSSMGAVIIGAPMIAGGLILEGMSVLVEKNVLGSRVEKMGLMFEEAKTGRGKHFDKLVRKVQRRHKSAKTEDIARILNEASAKELFCEKQADRLSTLKEIRKYVTAQLVSETEIKKSEDNEWNNDVDEELMYYLASAQPMEDAELAPL